MHRIRITIAAAILATSAQFSATSVADAQYYVVTDLGTIAGPLSNAKGLNDSGQVAGVSIVATSNFHAAVWNGGVDDLGTIGGDAESIAYAINDNGAAVGVSYDYGTLQPNAFVWQAGVLTPLGQFSPRDINNTGVIVGHRTLFNAENLWVEHASRWTSGLLEDLGTLGGHTSQAFAINDAGDIAGQAFLAGNQTVRACLWINGVPNDLGTLPGGATAKSAATDLNNAGQIVGWSDTAAGPSHACLFTVNAAGQVTGRTDLGALAGSSSLAMGVNDAGTIVGSSDYRGFVWESGVMSDLNTMISPGEGWTITRATGINAQGVIAADGVQLGFTHAVLLTPVDCLKGDINADGEVNGLDAQAMSRVLLNGGTSWELCAGDLDPTHDGLVTYDDVANFVQCLLGGPCG